MNEHATDKFGGSRELLTSYFDQFLAESVLVHEGILFRILPLVPFDLVDELFDGYHIGIGAVLESSLLDKICLAYPGIELSSEVLTNQLWYLAGIMIT